MPRTQVDRVLAAAEETHAHDPERAEAIARVRRFKAGWYELGETLTEIQRNEAYRRWSYATFEDYCRKELHLKMETVAKLTGSYGFLRKRAPEVLERDGTSGPIPTYQAVDFWRQAEESEAPAETVQEIRRRVLDEGVALPRLSRLYREVVFPVDEEEERSKKRTALSQAIDRLVELLAVARDAGQVPRDLAAEVEEPLQRLARQLAAN